MMKRLSSLAVQFCMATLLAQAIVVGYLWATGRVDRAKLAKVIAVLHGIDGATPTAEKPPEPSHPPTATKTVSMDEVLLARASKLQQLTQREQALDQRQALIESQQTKVAGEMQRLETTRSAFQKQLADWQTGQKQQALENTVSILAGMKAKQAKEQIALMLQKDELDWVVRIMELLPTSQRSKIVAEFKSAEEGEQLAEVIRNVRDAALQTALADEARKALSTKTP